jgi:hypothetical protein
VVAAAIVPPLNAMLDDPGTAVKVPPQSLAAPFGLATSKPAGSGSVNATPVSTVGFELLIVKSTDVVAFAATNCTGKNFAIVGGATTARAVCGTTAMPIATKNSSVLTRPGTRSVTHLQFTAGHSIRSLRRTHRAGEKLRQIPDAAEREDRVASVDPPVAPIDPPPKLTRRTLLRSAAGATAGAALATTSGALPAWARAAAAATAPTRKPGSLPFPHLPTGTPSMPQIQHIVVLMLENHSFDNLLGMVPHSVHGRSKVDGFKTDRRGNPVDFNRDASGHKIRATHASSPCQVPHTPSQAWTPSHMS